MGELLERVEGKVFIIRVKKSGGATEKGPTTSTCRMVFRGKMVSDLGKTSGIVPKKWMNPDTSVDTARV
jgi:hypothetical protein